MTTLEAVRQFLIPPSVVEITTAQLREAGRDRMERFVLWSGVQSDHSFLVRTAHVPRQKAYRLPDGLCVRVEGDELHRLNVWLYEHQEILGIQVHSHPTEAYHSETDDTYPIVTMRGGLSLVVPDFGRSGTRGPDVAWYRLGMSGWAELTATDTERLVRFQE